MHVEALMKIDPRVRIIAGIFFALALTIAVIAPVGDAGAQSPCDPRFSQCR